jgi:hypothetical protein
MCYAVPDAQIMQQFFLFTIKKKKQKQKILSIKCHMWPQNDVVLGFLLVTLKLFSGFLHNNIYVCIHRKKLIFC